MIVYFKKYKMVVDGDRMYKKYYIFARDKDMPWIYDILPIHTEIIYTMRKTNNNYTSIEGDFEKIVGLLNYMSSLSIYDLNKISFDIVQDFLYTVCKKNITVTVMQRYKYVLTLFALRCKELGIGEWGDHYLLIECASMIQLQKYNIKNRYELKIDKSNAKKNNEKLEKNPPAFLAKHILKACDEIYPMCRFLCVLEMYAGVRIGTSCNLRQDRGKFLSKYGSGIKVDEINKTAVINFKHSDLMLNSTLVSVGGIKKEGEVRVLPEYYSFFIKEYKRHLSLIKDLECEDTYPLFLNKNVNKSTGKHMALTVKNAKYLVTKIMQRAIENCRKEGETFKDYRLISFCDAFDGKHLASHAMRHIFTVNLVKMGKNPYEIQIARGDSNIESAQTYYNKYKYLYDEYQAANKKELEELNINNE